MNNFPDPEDAVDSWKATLEPTLTCEEVLINVKQFPFFGPWVAFKVADLLERVLQVPVDFSRFELGVYSEPRKGAALVLTGDAGTPITNEDLNSVVTALLRSPLGKMKAPPGRDRRVNVQEAETILCKYKSHCGGHYELGKDTKEVFHGLGEPRWGKTAKRLQTAVAPLMEQWR